MASWQVPTWQSAEKQPQAQWRTGGPGPAETWRQLRSPGNGQPPEPLDLPRNKTALQNAYQDSMKQHLAGDPADIQQGAAGATVTQQAGAGGSGEKQAIGSLGGIIPQPYAGPRNWGEATPWLLNGNQFNLSKSISRKATPYIKATFGNGEFGQKVADKWDDLNDFVTDSDFANLVEKLTNPLSVFFW